MTLYEMTDSARALYQLLESGEIDNETFNDTIEAIGADEKLEAYCQIIKQLKAESEMFAAEKKRLADKQCVLDNNVNRMRGAMLEYMLASGQKKAKAGSFSVSVGTSKSIDITDENAIPAIYRTPQPDKIDKAQIKTDIGKGAVVPGARIAEASSLTIR